MQELEEVVAPGILKSFSCHIRMPVRRCLPKHLRVVIVRIPDCFRAGGVQVVGYSYESAAVSTCSSDLLHFEVVVVVAVDNVDEDASDDDDCCCY